MNLIEYDRQVAHNRLISNWARITRPIFGNLTEVEYYHSTTLIVSMELDRIRPKLEKIFESDNLFRRMMK